MRSLFTSLLAMCALQLSAQTITGKTHNKEDKQLSCQSQPAAIRHMDIIQPIPAGEVTDFIANDQNSEKKEAANNNPSTIHYTAYKQPLVNHDLAPGNYVLTGAELDRMPYSNINDIMSTLPGVYQAHRGGSVSIMGSR